MGVWTKTMRSRQALTVTRMMTRMILSWRRCLWSGQTEGVAVSQQQTWNNKRKTALSCEMKIFSMHNHSDSETIYQLKKSRKKDSNEKFAVNFNIYLSTLKYTAA